ncbi:hypothetical protein MMC07_006185 [Pseudocyphellaria aurata]|nr:hypothetical protein [Pseudocyphellaria aurata]
MAGENANCGGAQARELARHAEKLSLLPPGSEKEETRATTAVEAKFITPQDAIIETADGGRLPPVPLPEAIKLNELKEKAECANREETGGNCERSTDGESPTEVAHLPKEEATSNGFRQPISIPRQYDLPLSAASPSQQTHPLFPQLPLYGPPTVLRNLQCVGFRISSFFLSLTFLGTIVLGAAFTSIPLMLRHITYRLTFRDPNARRPFCEEEKRRKRQRRIKALEWKRQRRRKDHFSETMDNNEEEGVEGDEFPPTEGGNDPIVCDVGYYARRVGLDMEEYSVQTEDGFIIKLWHLYNPSEYTPVSAAHRSYRTPEIFSDVTNGHRNGFSQSQFGNGKRKYPVLLVHGLLQSAGAYCTNDDDSLAFFLCKSGYDVWLGNNRCGFRPQHDTLHYGDPRMWNWNIRQMGVLDLPSLISRVLAETGFEKLGLICHSQGTTETFVALAKEQRPDLGNKISVFCALAPAVYAGPLIGKAYFKFMRVISPGMFRMIFGIHAFIPSMMAMHRLLPGKVYGALGYRVFSFLFNWTDDRWEQDLRARMFQFAPVYVSAESMRWWLGRECFAKHKCILATKDIGRQEDLEDEEDYDVQKVGQMMEKGSDSSEDSRQSRGQNAWYDDQVPPFALWVGGSDELVDGRRLLRRFERGREPHVRVVHSKIIEEYEHLDVIWAMDSVDKVAKEIREVVWKTASVYARDVCRVPKGCESVKPWTG